MSACDIYNRFLNQIVGGTLQKISVQGYVYPKDSPAYTAHIQS